MPEFAYHFEMSHFHMTIGEKTKAFRYDFHRDWINEITWKPGSDFVPEFNIYYDSAQIITMHDYKPIKGTDKLAYYYPAFRFKFRLVRNPTPKIVSFFIPSFVMGLFLTCVFQFSRFDKNNRLTNLSVVLLTYIGLMLENRSSLPEV